MINLKGQAFIGDLDGAKIYNSINSANKLSSISTSVGTSKWMSPEMRKSWINELMVTTELSKSDIFSLGLITLYCIDTNNFRKDLSPILEEFHTKMKLETLEEHLKKLEGGLKKYLDYFKSRISQSPEFSNFFSIYGERMLSFDHQNRPSIQELFEYFSDIERFVRFVHEEIVYKSLNSLQICK